MTELISRKHGKKSAARIGTCSLFVRGVPYSNSAAKFWPSLVDEIREDFPDCSLIELIASTPGKFGRRHLFPELAFERDLLRLLNANLQDVMRDAVAELEILGPPSSVQVHLLSGQEELLSCELSTDCIDAEIFPYLATWLLEWAGIPDSRWNNEFLAGDITAEDKKRRLVYQISFDMVNRHLSEDLYQRSISLTPSVIRAE